MEAVGPILSAPEFASSLEGVSMHVQRADGWARERLAMFPNLASVSVDFGVAFALQFGVTLTWTRTNQGASK